MSLPPALLALVANLDAKIDAPNAGWSEHDRDVFRAIRQCILDCKPIDKELQDNYVRAIANDQAQNRYGK